MTPFDAFEPTKLVHMGPRACMDICFHEKYQKVSLVNLSPFSMHWSQLNDSLGALGPLLTYVIIKICRVNILEPTKWDLRVCKAPRDICCHEMHKRCHTLSYDPF